MTERNSPITSEHLYEEIINSKKEIKNSIAASETRILLEFQALKNKVEQLEAENQFLKNKIEHLDRINKKNNIIFFGLKKTADEITPQFICDEIKRSLKIEIKENDINDCYKLGKNEDAPIKIELISYLKKREILSNAKILKQTNLSILNDQTEQQREEYKILKSNLLKAKASAPQKKSFIRGNRLIVGSAIYTVQDLINKQVENKASSAPPTPSTSKHGGSATNEEDENTSESIWEDTETLEDTSSSKSNLEKKDHQIAKTTPKSTLHYKVFKKKISPKKNDQPRLRPRHGSTQC